MWHFPSAKTQNFVCLNRERQPVQSSFPFSRRYYKQHHHSILYSFFASGFFFPPCWVFLRNKICLNHEWYESISKCSLAYKEDFDETKSRTTNTKSGNQSILTVLLTTPLGLGLLSWREIFQIMAPVMTCSINCAECLRHEDHHESIFIKNSEFPNQCHRPLDSEVCSD